MKHYLFVNKYNAKLYSADREIKREKFNYENEKLDIINNSMKLDIEKERYILVPNASPFEIGIEHAFSIETLFGKRLQLLYFIFIYLEQVLEMIENLKDIVIIFSVSVIDGFNMRTLNNILKEQFKDLNIYAVIKDYLFVGALSHLSIYKDKSLCLVSGFNLTKCRIYKKGIERSVSSIWVDKTETIENIKYYGGSIELINKLEYQKAFDLALDNRLNYNKKEEVDYITRDHHYKIDVHIIDEYISKMKDKIKESIEPNMFYLFDISFPLIYDEFVNNLKIDIDKKNEVDEFYKYVIEYLQAILSFNTPLFRINSKKRKNKSINDNYTEYELAVCANKRINNKDYFKSKYMEVK